jgi:hypothetical protein
VDQAVWDRLRVLASTEHGLFTLAQACATGACVAGLRHAVDRGWLRTVRRGVYAFAGRPPHQWESSFAAWLAAGPAAVISHRSAAAMHRFWGIVGGQPELTILGRTGRNMAGVRIHRPLALFPSDVVQRNQIQVTSPIRTLIDVAPSISDHVLSRVIDEGTIARMWTAERIITRLDAPSVERPSPRLRRLLGLRLDESNPDSVLEQRVLRAIKPWVPPFVVHHRVEAAGRILELDVAWPEYLLGAEIDGRQVRIASRSKFDSDRLRSNLLELAGWRIVHLTAGMDHLTLLAQLIPFFPPELIDVRLRADLSSVHAVRRR